MLESAAASAEVWMGFDYLRKSDNGPTNPPCHDFFMGLLEKYPGTISLSDTCGSAAGHP